MFNCDPHAYWCAKEGRSHIRRTGTVLADPRAPAWDGRLFTTLNDADVGDELTGVSRPTSIRPLRTGSRGPRHFEWGAWFFDTDAPWSSAVCGGDVFAARRLWQLVPMWTTDLSPVSPDVRSNKWAERRLVAGVLAAELVQQQDGSLLPPADHTLSAQGLQRMAKPPRRGPLVNWVAPKGFGALVSWTVHHDQGSRHLTVGDIPGLMATRRRQIAATKDALLKMWGTHHARS